MMQYDIQIGEEEGRIWVARHNHRRNRRASGPRLVNSVAGTAASGTIPGVRVLPGNPNQVGSERARSHAVPLPRVVRFIP